MVSRIIFLREFGAPTTATGAANGVPSLKDARKEAFVPENVYDAMKENKRFDSMRVSCGSTACEALIVMINSADFKKTLKNTSVSSLIPFMKNSSMFSRVLHLRPDLVPSLQLLLPTTQPQLPRELSLGLSLHPPTPKDPARAGSKSVKSRKHKLSDPPHIVLRRSPTYSEVPFVLFYTPLAPKIV
jgi:hypothetical protein